MRIGLDIDNVILDFDKCVLEAMLREDKNKRNNQIVNLNADYIFSGMLDWTKDEIRDFLDNNLEKIAENFTPLDDAKFYMDKLIDEGYELYLITNRVYPHYKNAKKTTIENLKKNKINYTKLIFSETNDKSEICIANKIDIFFDDRLKNCLYLKKNNIRSCLMKSRYEKRNIEEVDVVTSWKELYEKIKSLD